MITGIFFLLTKVLDTFRRHHKAAWAQQIPENMSWTCFVYVFSLSVQYYILRKTLLTHQQGNGPSYSNLLWFWNYYFFLFVPVFLFYYFSLNYYFSNIRSDSWGEMLLVIWAVTGDLRGQCLMSHCLMIRKCAYHQTMLLFHYLEIPFLSYCYIDFLYPCGFSSHSLFKKKKTNSIISLHPFLYTDWKRAHSLRV